jgi:hypothetical protein
VALVVGDGREDGEFCVKLSGGGIAGAGDGHDGRDVAAAVAVVGRRPDCDDGFGGEVELSVIVLC